MKDKKTISFRGNLNGEMLEELVGSIEQRIENERYLIDQLSNPKVSTDAKKHIEKRLDLQVELVKDASEKQITMSYLKLSKFITLFLTVAVFGLVSYLIIHNAINDLDLTHATNQFIVGLIAGLGTFWIGIVVAIFKKGGDVKIKSQKLLSN